MAEKDKWSWDEEDKDVEVIEDPKEPAEKGDPKKEDPKEPVEPSFDFGEEKEEEEEEEKGPKDPNIKAVSYTHLDVYKRQYSFMPAESFLITGDNRFPIKNLRRAKQRLEKSGMYKGVPFTFKVDGDAVGYSPDLSNALTPLYKYAGIILSLIHI